MGKVIDFIYRVYAYFIIFLFENKINAKITTVLLSEYVGICTLHLTVV